MAIRITSLKTSLNTEVDLRDYESCFVIDKRVEPYVTTRVYPSTTTAATQPASAMTSNTAPSPYKAYASSRYSATYYPWKAFTKSVSTQGWASASNNNGSMAWIALDLGEGNKLRDPKIGLWNRDNATVNGCNTAYVFGSNELPVSGDGTTPTAMPSDAVLLGTFVGLDGSVRSNAYVLDCVGDETSNCTRGSSSQEIKNAQTKGFRYIIVASDDWVYTSSARYLVIGRITIDGSFES